MPTVKVGGIYSLKIDIKFSGESNSIICLAFSNILIDSYIVYLPVANSNCCLDWFKGLQNYSLLNAECLDRYCQLSC